jgi:hypothetical protein
MEKKYVAVMEGYLRFREEGEDLEQTLSIHFLYILEGGNFFAVCLDYNEGCSIPLRNYVKYLHESDNEKTMLNLLADSTRELLATVLDYITSGQGEEEAGLELFQTGGELWDSYRYFMRSYDSFIFGEGKDGSGKEGGPYMSIEDDKKKSVVEKCVPGYEYEVLEPEILEPALIIKKELLDTISETRKE